MTKPETRLIHVRDARLGRVTVNPPIERASTVLFSEEDALYGTKPTYGRMGLTVHRELEQAMCELEGGTHTKLTSNGLQACSLAIGSLVRAGDHVLYTDSIYGPTARFCNRRLRAMGVESSIFDPRIGAKIETLIQPNTKLIVLESPGSLTFEISDTPAIVKVAKQHGVLTVLDNTWGAGLHHQPLALGVDVSVQALTKYVVGHSDVFGGAVMTRDERLYNRINACADDWGISLSPDNAFTALRGLRTLHTRLKAHEAAALKIAKWLEAQPEVSSVLHPALPSSPDHEIWKRDFSGSCGLFGLILNPVDDTAVTTLFETLNLFTMGFSWGGFESLLIPCDRQLTRQTGSWVHTRAGPLLRLHIGLEDPDDLIADLAKSFASMSGRNAK
ncbi:MAG: cystathionine beta-lyase [Hyphomonas sp.]